ncbi:MAG: hypothetical protein IPJ40_05090 [Saprospirales bacterium]|nr:hypothetical protein [Saprospirales bacterium]
MRIFIFILSVMSAVGLSGQTLEDYLNIALENNPGIMAGKMEYKAALQKYRKLAPCPSPR